MKKTYLEIQVPLRYDADWFQWLRRAFDRIRVRWQPGFHHITMVFIDDTPQDVDLLPIIEKHLGGLPAPTLEFDKLDAFTVTNGGMHIINLTTTHVPQEFLATIEALRKDLQEAGCRIDSSFRLHVTLGRVLCDEADLATIQAALTTVAPPKFTLCLTDVDYREFRGKTLYQTTLNVSDNEPGEGRSIVEMKSE